MRKHAELIKAWAEGAEIQFKNGANWMDIPVPAWSEIEVYRVKPSEPVAPIVLTGMTDKELVDCYGPVRMESAIEAYRRIANAAIARAIADGQVIPVTEHAKFSEKIAEGKRKAIDKLNAACCAHNMKLMELMEEMEQKHHREEWDKLTHKQKEAAQFAPQR